MIGLDYASTDSQHPPDWAAIKASGVSFVILRGAYGNWVDTTFTRDYQALADHGFVRGAYLFLRYPRQGSTPPSQPGIQAHALVSALARYPRGPLDLPPCLDIEFPGDGRVDTGMTAQQCLDWARVAWQVLRDGLGVPPPIYTSARVWREDLQNLPAPDLTESPLWLAAYALRGRMQPMRDALAVSHLAWPATPKPWGDPGNSWIHQYQGDAIGFPGLNSTVDLNRFRVLRGGDSGDRVKWVQRRLGRIPTGTFDADLETVVRTFQRMTGLEQDGVVGPRTFAQLCWSGVERV